MDFEIEKLSVWEKLKDTKEPIIMYGTGNGSDKVLDELERLGIELYGVTASNSFVRERTFRGYKVKPIEYFEEALKSFTVIITFGSSIKEVMDNIYTISKRHRTLVPVVPVSDNIIFNRDFLNANQSKINTAYNLMADSKSKEIFRNYVNFLFGGELKLLKDITTPENEAFSEILKLGESETYIDIGAYKGDTVFKFLSFTNGKYNKIICAEPDSKSYKKLLLNCEKLNNFKAYNSVLTDIDGDVYFKDLHGRQSSLGGKELKSSMNLISLCKGSEPTFIKIDSEGAEKLILQGGKEILSEFQPKLNVAVYHRSEDIFTLPILISKANKNYKIHLRHHPYIPAWDTNLYCV